MYVETPEILDGLPNRTSAAKMQLQSKPTPRPLKRVKSKHLQLVMIHSFQAQLLSTHRIWNGPFIVRRLGILRDSEQYRLKGFLVGNGYHMTRRVPVKIFRTTMLLKSASVDLLRLSRRPLHVKSSNADRVRLARTRAGAIAVPLLIHGQVLGDWRGSDVQHVVGWLGRNCQRVFCNVCACCLCIMAAKGAQPKDELWSKPPILRVPGTSCYIQN